MTFDLDLDLLVDNKKKIHLNGKEIEIESPDVLTLFSIFKLLNDFQNVQNSKKADSVIDAFEAYKKKFNELFPVLEQEKLNFRQMMGLLIFIVQESTTVEQKELKDKGISFDNDQKKIVSSSLEPSPTS
jgi:hypothetical protein